MFIYFCVQGPAGDAEHLERRELREKSRQAAATNSRPAAHPQAASSENTKIQIYAKTKRQTGAAQCPFQTSFTLGENTNMQRQKTKRLGFTIFSDIFGNSCDNVILHTWNRC